jgi:hypothetical protein
MLRRLMGSLICRMCDDIGAFITLPYAHYRVCQECFRERNRRFHELNSGGSYD